MLIILCQTEVVQSKQKINLSCTTKIGIESESSLYSPVSIFYFQQIGENDFNIILESRGQISEIEILERCIDNLKYQINNLIKDIPEKNEKKGTMAIGNYDHTIGNLIAYYCYQNKNVDMFSYNIPHPLQKLLHLNYNLNKGEIKDIIIEETKVIISDLDIIKSKLKILIK